MAFMEKPPLGVLPRKIHEKQRMLSLLDAIWRYYEAGLMPHGEWLKEVRDYVERQ